MESSSNVEMICKDCVPKKYPSTGKFTRKDVEHKEYVKKRFIDGERKEHMWIRVQSLDDKGVHGLLDNDPVLVQNVKCNDAVFACYAEIEDVL